MDDLRAVERELGADELSWRIGSREPLGNWSWKNVYIRSESLDELTGNAPKGRIYEFEMQAEVGDQSFVLLMVSKEPRFLTLSYEGPGDDTPEIFRAVSSLVKKAEKRGEKWFYAGAVVGPMLALFIPLNILDQVGNLGLLYNETGPHRNVGAAFGWAIVSFLTIAFVAAGFGSWAVASSVTLRPVIDTASMVERAVDGAKSAGRWFVSFPRAEYMYKLIMLWATVVAAVCGVGGFVVALLK